MLISAVVFWNYPGIELKFRMRLFQLQLNPRTILRWAAENQLVEYRQYFY